MEIVTPARNLLTATLVTAPSFQGRGRAPPPGPEGGWACPVMGLLGGVVNSFHDQMRLFLKLSDAPPSLYLDCPAFVPRLHQMLLPVSSCRFKVTSSESGLSEHLLLSGAPKRQGSSHTQRLLPRRGPSHRDSWLMRFLLKGTVHTKTLSVVGSSFVGFRT